MFGLMATIVGGLGLLSALFSASSPFFLVLALLGFILALVFGIIGLRKNVSESDRILAIIGLCLAVLAFVVLITIVFISVENVLVQRRLLVG